MKQWRGLPPPEPDRLALKDPTGSNVQLLELSPTLAAKPFALAGRTPVPLSVSSALQLALPLAIARPFSVQYHCAMMVPWPLHLKLQVYGRSTRAAVLASGRADGAVRALGSRQPASKAAPSSKPPAFRIGFIVPSTKDGDDTCPMLWPT